MAPKRKINTEEPKNLPKKPAKMDKKIGKIDQPVSINETGANKIVEPVKTEQTLASASETVEAPIEKTKSASPSNPSNANRSALMLGGGLVIMGIILLLGKILSIPFGDYLWPFIFIVPGALVFLTSLASDSSSGEGLSILGAIITTLGLVFLIQEITGFWASWAYAWALIAPTSIGVAQMTYGTRKNRDTIVQSGKKLINLGLSMFAIGFVFFEIIIYKHFGISKFGLPVFPMIMIFIGAVILIRALIKKH